MSEMEKWKMLEKIRISSLRNRGDVLAVAKDLNLDLAYVKRCIDKQRKRESRDVCQMISSTLMAHLFEGYEMRMHYITELLRSLDGRHQVSVSDCCRHIIETNEQGIVCRKCTRPCSVIVLDQHGVYALKQTLIVQLREEDKTLVDFAAKMGYTEKQDAPAAVKYEDKRQIIVMGDSGITKELADLGPLEREALRMKLERQLFEGKQEGNNGAPESKQ